MAWQLRTLLFMACVWVMAGVTAQAQPAAFWLNEVTDEILDLDRPRVAVAPDGSAAVAFEAYVRGEFIDEWLVAVQRFSPSGAPVGPLHRFEPESACGSFDSWSSDAQHHAELAFRSDGVLVVVMQHSGWFSLAGVDDVRSAEITIGAVGTDGQRIDLDPEWNHCTQHKLIFVGAGRQDRPRFALMPNDAMLVTADGFFQDSDLRNVGIRALGPELEELIEEVIPHDDPRSQQAFHMQPDIATNGTLVLSAWQECPIVDQQGNANECDIGAQFATVAANGLQAVGVNQTVNAGDPVGTLNLYPSAAMNAAGNSVVVWADARTGPQGDIFAQRFNAQGQPVGANIRVSLGEGVIDLRPEVAIRDDGGFMVVWTDSTAGTHRARGRQFDAGGNPLGSPFAFTDETGVQTGLPDVASNGDDFVYVWGSSRGGSLGVFTNQHGAIVSNDTEPTRAAVRLEAYPNPFTTEATIRYHLSEPEVVTVTVYDVLGREVLRLAEGSQPAGEHELHLHAPALPSGTYLVRLQSGSAQRTVLLMRQQ